MNIYWAAIAVIILSVIISVIFIIKEIKNFSFEFCFLLMIPLWIGVLAINNFETNRVKEALRLYLSEYYPEKLKEYDQKPVELLNSDSEDILDLFADQELILDPHISRLNSESKRITLFMYTVFLGMPAVLYSSVIFLMRR